MLNLSLIKAIELLGGQVATSKIVGTSQTAVWKWLNTAKDGVSADYAIAVSQATDWQVTPHELRPDLYPHPDDGLPANLRSTHDHNLGRRSNDRRHRHVVIKTT